MSAHGPVLLVEDNDDDAELCMRSMKRGRVGNALVRARDGVEALELLGLRKGALAPLSTPPLLVLLDLRMPRMDGHEVLAAVRADPATRMLPVVVLTTSAQRSDLVGAYTAGANSYIVKPVDFAQFDAAIRQLELYWLVLNHPPPVRGG